MSAITALIVTFVQAQSGASQTKDVSRSQQKTLRDLAKERDVELSTSDEFETELTDLRSSAQSSSTIVVGRIAEAKTSFTESGEFIVTNYLVQIQRVLKDMPSSDATLLGKAPAPPLTDTLTITRLGGDVRVNGNRASIKVKGHESLKAGGAYVFFLNWSSDHKSYILTGGISGVVLVKDNLRVEPLASAETIARKYSDTDLESFINEVLKLY